MNALNTLRKARGWTQEDLEAKSGVAQDAISAIETGRVRNPRWQTVRRLSDALGVHPKTVFPADETEEAQAS